MTTLLNGLLGGLVVGAVAAVAAERADDGRSVTRAVLDAVAGPDAAGSLPGRALLRVAYGGAAGLALLALELYALGMLAVPPTLGEAAAVAVGWSAVLFVVVFAVARLAFDDGRGGSDVRGLLLYHLVFGLGMALWIRTTWIT